jgi:hypothetical protein
MAQVIEHLPSKCVAVRSNPNTTKLNKKCDLIESFIISKTNIETNVSTPVRNHFLRKGKYQ